MIISDATDKSVDKVHHLRGFKTLIYPKGFTLKMENSFSDVAELVISQQPKPWSGPEDGLPPVGTVCEFNDSCGGQWHKVEIMYVSKHTILIKFFGGEFQDVEGAYSPEESVCFRAIKTPEQLRETAIRELMDIAQVDCRVTAARLVDAGFKREGV